MERLKPQIKLAELYNKYKFALLIVAVGLFLMVTPMEMKEDTQSSGPVTVEPELTMDERLTRILGQIQGVGKVQVMITEQTGSENVYQTDDERTEGEGNDRIKSETVITSSGGVQSGLIRTVTPPTYLGAIIVCQGGGNPSVRLAVANAVASVTGLGLDRISVLEMK